MIDWPGREQDEVLEALRNPAAFGPTIRRVSHVDTHISRVYLAGERAYKLKRQVRLPFLDYSTPEQRRRYCDLEYRLNSRLSPALYIGVKPVTREANGEIVIDGKGEPVDWVVVMHRFTEDEVFEAMAKRGVLTEPDLMELARLVARAHEEAETLIMAGGAEANRVLATDLIATMRAHPAEILDPTLIDRLHQAFLAEIDARADLLDSRADDGAVRRCHGDLHLRNIVLWNGTPTLFDAIEFNDAFTVIDTAYDLAFLLMDLDRRDMRAQASQVFNRYLEFRPDLDCLGVLPLFLALRAGVRAFASAASVDAQEEGKARVDLSREGRAYLDAALGYLRPAPRALVAIGGLSGSGKSRLARALAPHYARGVGAVVLRTDVIRKQIHGVDPFQRLPPEAYAPEESVRVYDRLFHHAEQVLKSGHPVILDGVFAKPEERARVEQLGRATGTAARGIWLEAAATVAAERISGRGANASDATAEVLARQQSYDLGEIDWMRIDSSGPRAATLQKAMKKLGISSLASIDPRAS